MQDYLQRQIDARQSAWHAAKALLDAAAAEKRDLTAEEEQSYQRMIEDIDVRAQKIKDLQGALAREADIQASVASAPEVRGLTVVRNDADILRQLATGEIRSHVFGWESRDLNKTDDSSLLPQTFYQILQENMQTVGPMLDGSVVTLITTASGEDIKVPVESTRPAATAIAEATAITPLDPTFSSLTLKAQKVAVLTKVSRELLTDSGIDLEAYLGRALGISLGIKVNSLLTVGTGTVEPKGIMDAAGSGVAGTATTGVFTADNLIDLAHSVDGAYARMGAVWMMRRATMGAVRKLTDAGGYIFQPAATVGVPDTLLGFPIIENPDVAAVGSANRSVGFGWAGSYHTRVVGGIEIARSDDAYFNTDEIGFRATIRVWGDLGQSGAFKYFKAP